MIVGIFIIVALIIMVANLVVCLVGAFTGADPDDSRVTTAWRTLWMLTLIALSGALVSALIEVVLS